MNIKDIALKVLRDEFPGMRQENQTFMIEFAETLVAELAKDNKPVAWLSRESESGRICLDVEDSGESGTWSPSFPVYELPPQPSRSSRKQQETAEAIAAMLHSNANKCYLTSDAFVLKANASLIIDGAWKEYK